MIFYIHFYYFFFQTNKLIVAHEKLDGFLIQNSSYVAVCTLRYIVVAFVNYSLLNCVPVHKHLAKRVRKN